MTIRKRIFISNTLMVLVSLLTLLVISGGLYGFFVQDFWQEGNKSRKVSGYAGEVQEMMGQVSGYQGDWEALANDLTVYDFNLYVSGGGRRPIYSNVSHGERECVTEMMNVSEDSDVPVLYHVDGVTIVRVYHPLPPNVGEGDFPRAGTNLDLFAVSGGSRQSGRGFNRGMPEMFGILAILTLLLCSQFFTGFLIKRILIPVEQLSRATRRVDEGNLDVPIGYKRKDEFYEVCQTFDLMQQHLKEGIEQKEAYERARTGMIAGISHDLRTPLTSVKGYIKGLQDGVATTPEKQAQYLEIAYRKACDMDVLLQKLFYFSKMETGNMPFYLQETDWRKWLLNYLDNRRQELKEQEVILSLECEEGSHPVELDLEQMRRVLDNILENSIKYAGNFAGSLEIQFRLLRVDQMEELTICDSGSGVEAEKLPYIFEQFYRCDESRGGSTKGNGLGLHICKFIVEAHGGSITARNAESSPHLRSAEGQGGLCLTIRIPGKDKR